MLLWSPLRADKMRKNRSKRNRRLMSKKSKFQMNQYQQLLNLLTLKCTLFLRLKNIWLNIFLFYFLKGLRMVKVIELLNVCIHKSSSQWNFIRLSAKSRGCYPFFSHHSQMAGHYRLLYFFFFTSLQKLASPLSELRIHSQEASEQMILLETYCIHVLGSQLYIVSERWWGLFCTKKKKNSDWECTAIERCGKNKKAYWRWEKYSLLKKKASETTCASSTISSSSHPVSWKRLNNALYLFLPSISLILIALWFILNISTRAASSSGGLIVIDKNGPT